MKNWRLLLASLSRASLVRAAVVAGVGGAAVGGYAGIGVLGGTVPFAEAMNLPAALAVLPDPLSIMTARSPGERGHGAMFNTKQTKRPRHRELAKAPPQGPRERVLSTVRERDPAPIVPAGALPITPAGFVPDLPTPTTPNALGALPPGGGIDGFSPPPVFPTGPGTGIPGVPNPTPTPTPTPTTPAPAVPEPATWATMTLGFAVIGIAVRRRKRTRASAA